MYEMYFKLQKVITLQKFTSYSPSAEGEQKLFFVITQAKHLMMLSSLSVAFAPHTISPNM